MDTTWTEQFYTPSQESSIDIDKMSVEELASLVEKAEKLLKEKQEAKQAEIKAWVDEMVRFGEMDFEALEHELFDNTQSVIDMLQRYLDKKGK